MILIALLLISLAACGDDGVRHILDAPSSPADVRRDAPLDPVSVTITLGGTPQEGLSVFFTNANGSPVATQLTDPTGTAAQEMAPGGSVTVVAPSLMVMGVARVAMPSNLYTWAGVKPGDELVLTSPGVGGIAGPTFTLATPVVAGATQYTAATWCNGVGNGGELAPPDGSAVLVPTGTVAMPPACSTADLVVSASDNAGNLLATLYHPALTVTQAETVDLGNDTFVPAASATFTYTDVPGTSITAQVTRVAPAGPLAQAQQTSDVGNTSATFTLDEPVIASATALVTTSFATLNNNHAVWDWGGSGGDYTLDVGAQALVEFAGAPAFDVAQETLTWAPGPSGVAPDLVSASIAPQNDAVIAGWSIVAPYAGGQLQLPPIPGYTLGASDTVQIAQLQTASVPGGYDAVRAYALAPTTGYFFIADGASGRALTDSYQVPLPPPPLATPIKHALRKRTR